LVATENAPHFIALHVEKRTVREAGTAIGVSKSQVTNLANLFQAKLNSRILELQRKGIGGSPEYKAAFCALQDRLYELREESGSDAWDWDGRIGHFKDSAGCREDLAECFGQSTPRYDGE